MRTFWKQLFAYMKVGSYTITLLQNALFVCLPVNVRTFCSLAVQDDGNVGCISYHHFDLQDTWNNRTRTPPGFLP